MRGGKRRRIRRAGRRERCSRWRGRARPALALVRALALMSLLVAGCAGLADLDMAGILEAGAPLDEGTVARGLGEALEVGARRTTTALSRPGAFADDPARHIALPATLGRFARTLRAVGLGGQVDALEQSMNAAAERAAGEAMPVFAGAIHSLTIADAFAILNGPDDAATRYFRERTSDELRTRFRPLAGDAMREVGLYQIYTQLVARYETLPLAPPLSVDLESIVADRTLDALFDVLADEEARIREDPAARTTALLRRVFGSAAGSGGASGL